jgi:hypothetical protein
MTAIDITDQWLQRTIIGLNLCPFARVPYHAGRVGLVLCQSAEEKDQHDFFWNEVKKFVSADPQKISNTLLIFEYGEKDFVTFYEMVSLWEEMLQQSSMGKELQLVVFHPAFYFGGTNPQEHGNLVNRSPFPTLHLLRVSEVAQATASLQAGENIAWSNKHKIEQLNDEQRDYYWWFLTAIP